MASNSYTPFLFARIAPCEQLSIAVGITETLRDMRESCHGLSLVQYLTSFLQHCRNYPSGFEALPNCEHVLQHILDVLLTWTICYLNSAPAEDQINTLVETCTAHASIIDAVIDACTRSLSQKATSDTALQAGQVTSTETQEASQSLEVSTMVCLEPLQSLRFLRSYFCRSSPIASSCSWEILQPLLIISGSTPYELAASSHDVAFKMICSVKEHSDWKFYTLWKSLSGLVEQPEPGWSRNHGLSIWLRLISSSPDFVPSTQFCQKTAYWTLLRNILADGTAEQQKLCLSILSASIDAAQHTHSSSNAGRVSSDYGKYIALFETIALARYVNQVQECLLDLSSLVEAQCAVEPSWIVALLSAALSAGMQDSIRRIIGNWTMGYAYSVIHQSGLVGASFLEHKFLPWATLGHFFTSTLQAAPVGNPVCEHGESLSRLIVRLLSDCAEPDLSSRIFKAISNFLDEKGCYIYAYARAFILDGLTESLRQQRMGLDLDCLDSIARIASVRGFQEIAEDLMTVQCASLVSLVRLDLMSTR